VVESSKIIALISVIPDRQIAETSATIMTARPTARSRGRQIIGGKLVNLSL
jgi:hypothetical protein